MNYKRFCSLDGSEYIASEFALATILRLIKHFKIKNLLELGLGIGSISDTVLKYVNATGKPLKYAGTENNKFCLGALPKNVLNFKQIDLYNQLKTVPKQAFDLIIVDGLDDDLNHMKDYVSSRCILFVEGDRKLQTGLLLNMFPNHLYVNIITLN